MMVSESCISRRKADEIASGHSFGSRVSGCLPGQLHRARSREREPVHPTRGFQSCPQSGVSSVGAGKARVFVQNGEIVFIGFDSYRPHCAFEITSVQHDGAVIEADNFAISRVQGSLQPVVSAEPMRVAALRLPGWMGAGMAPRRFTWVTTSGFHLSLNRRSGE